MEDRKDIVAGRIAGICNAKPVDIPVAPKKAPQNTQSDRPEREQVFRLGSVYTGRNARIRCVVNDVNEKGARLTLQAVHQMPESVVVKFDQTGSRIRADVIWQQEDVIGIEFSADQSDVDTVCPPGAILKKS